MIFQVFLFCLFVCFKQMKRGKIALKHKKIIILFDIFFCISSNYDAFLMAYIRDIHRRRCHIQISHVAKVGPQLLCAKCVYVCVRNPSRDWRPHRINSTSNIKLYWWCKSWMSILPFVRLWNFTIRWTKRTDRSTHLVARLLIAMIVCVCATMKYVNIYTNWQINSQLTLARWIHR